MRPPKQTRMLPRKNNWAFIFRICFLSMFSRLILKNGI
jgi:hypothetical protein